MTDRTSEPGLLKPLRGRARECVQLDGLIAAVQGGESRSLVLRGEAGIGKTALLEYLIAAASEMTVVRAVGVESEMELAFASLHQLCAPLLDRLAKLPAPQRQALEIVFGQRTGDPPDRFLVGLAVLSLFSEVGRGAPAALRRRRRAVGGPGVGADARLRGPAPAGRAGRDRVRSARAGRGAPAPPRARGATACATATPARCWPRRCRRCSTSGCATGSSRRRAAIPLALLELPRGLTATQLAGGFGIPERECAFRDGSRRATSAGSRRFPTTRACCCWSRRPSRVGDPLLLRRASERLGIDDAAVDATDGPARRSASA